MPCSSETVSQNLEPILRDARGEGARGSAPARNLRAPVTSSGNALVTTLEDGEGKQKERVGRQPSA